jgi:putative endonuclease
MRNPCIEVQEDNSDDLQKTLGQRRNDVKVKDTTSCGEGDGRASSGKRAEDLAARFLEQRGLHILIRNYRCRGGEIDLVCHAGKALVFVEVRLRRNSTYGGAGASITPTKQRRIILAAQHYLMTHSAGDSECRFDCILFDGPHALTENRIEWVRDAFSAN